MKMAKQKQTSLGEQLIAVPMQVTTLLNEKGFILTHASGRYVRRQDDSILLWSLISGNWMHNKDYKPLAEGASSYTLRAYLEKLT